MIPVVLIHKGASERYSLGLVVEQSRKWHNQTVFLGDEEINIFSRGVKEFAEHYEHLSSNHEAFELFCIARWFILYDWMSEFKIDRVFYADSDVLLFCDVEKEWDIWGEGYGLTLSHGTSPATSYITRSGLLAFLSFVQDIYYNHNENYFELKRIFAEMRAQNLPGGICDMTLFKFFREQVTHVKVGEMSDIKKGATFDHNINSRDNLYFEKGHKKIWMSDGIPYGEWFSDSTKVRFNALHFQGGAKNLIREYVTK